jgi:Mrp family chromosome partitioning ATPase
MQERAAEIHLPRCEPIGTIAAMTTGELSGCVVVSGMPGAGKTTVTRLAAPT